MKVEAIAHRLGGRNFESQLVFDETAKGPRPCC